MLADLHVKVGLGWLLNQIEVDAGGRCEFTRVQPGAEFGIEWYVTAWPSHNPPKLTAACSHSPVLVIGAQPTRFKQDGSDTPPASWYTAIEETTQSLLPHLQSSLFATPPLVLEHVTGGRLLQVLLEESQ